MTQFEKLIERIWQELLDKDDRTSPSEYPDMVLVTRKELTQIAIEVWREAQP